MSIAALRPTWPLWGKGRKKTFVGRSGGEWSEEKGRDCVTSVTLGFGTRPRNAVREISRPYFPVKEKEKINMIMTMTVMMTTIIVKLREIELGLLDCQAGVISTRLPRTSCQVIEFLERTISQLHDA